MLRQIHIFMKSELLFVQSYAVALGAVELENIQNIIQKYIDMPVHGKTFTNHVSNFQIFHRSSKNVYFVFVTDICDSLQYVESLMLKTIKKLEELFPNPHNIKEPSSNKSEFLKFLVQLQKDLHSKISIIGPMNSGKTTLYNMLKTDDEKLLTDFAKITQFEIGGVSFDLWDFVIQDHFSLLWSKFINGSDLVILVFNLANYHVKIVNHFLNLQKLEGKYSNLLVIGNKRELVDESEIKRIKNILNIGEFEEFSLSAPDAKAKITQLLMDKFKLKKKFPSNFGEMVKEVDDLVLENKKVQALAKYKELLSVSQSYQNIIYTKALEQKISDLTEKIKDQTEKRREIESKKEFPLPKTLVFTRKISVKPLPSPGSTDQSLENNLIEELSAPPSKPIQKMVSFQKLDSKPTVKPRIIQKKPSKLIVKPTVPKIFKEDKTPIKPVSTKKLKPKMPIELFSPNEDIVKELESPIVIDFPKELQKRINEGGSSLSFQLCERLITELKNSLDRPISLIDVRMAADFFIKQEQIE